MEKREELRKRERNWRKENIDNRDQRSAKETEYKRRTSKRNEKSKKRA